MKRIVISVALSFQLLVLNVCCDDVTVRYTENGPVEGTELLTSLGQQYVAFKGIPFAEPPVTGTDLHTGEWIDRRFKVLYTEIVKYEVHPRVHRVHPVQVNHIDQDHNSLQC